jgi:hypothetical protein
MKLRGFLFTLALSCSVLTVGLVLDPSAAQQRQQQSGSLKRSHSPLELPALARKMGEPATLPTMFADPLGFGNSEIAVTRLGYAHDPTKSFRALDLIPTTKDFLMFIRRDKHIVFWRISSEGRVLSTVEAISGVSIKRVDNARFATDFNELCEFFYSLLPGEE